MRSRLAVSLAAAAFVLAAAPARIIAQSPKAVSAFLSTVSVMPQLGKQTMPLVPAQKQTGIFDAEIVVDTSGSIAHARAVQSTDATGELDKACLEAMKTWKLRPATAATGERIPTLVRIRFTAAPPAAPGKASAVDASLFDIVAMPPPSTTSAAVTAIDAKAQGNSWPRVIREIKPRYTAEGMRAKLQGTVHMEVVVLADGTVGSARVIKGLGFGLDESALAAARYWLFEPAKVDGKPVASSVTLELEFRLH